MRKKRTGHRPCPKPKSEMREPDPLVGLPEALERGPGRPEVETLFC